MDSYGILYQDQEGTLECAVSSIKRKGFYVFRSDMDHEEIENIKYVFSKAYALYGEKYKSLEDIDEHNTIRCPLLLDKVFLKIASNKKVLGVVKSLMGDNFILNQQNAIINPAKSSYNQALWHRDLPYQHFVSSRPLAINALYCVDSFNGDNGGTWVIPGSHLFENYPSLQYANENKIQVAANEGDIIIIDSMLYHRGGDNMSSEQRRAVNNVYSSPIIRRQIDFEEDDIPYPLSDADKKVLGLSFKSYTSVSEYLNSRQSKK
ncbi:hypothetical protein GCM10009104_13750 [Marinobacterium maritimum]|uniref:Phytanoyl-CoA dioxygenase n=1 Tax=Marinobacterium maritimum TaxID=500162 RepID=A0ABP3T7M0_9GAMM